MLEHSEVEDIRELRPLKQSVCYCVSYTLVLWYLINMIGSYMYYGTIIKDSQTVSLINVCLIVVDYLRALYACILGVPFPIEPWV